MNKEAYKAKANQRIDEVSAKINEIKALMARAEYDAEQKYAESLQALKKKRDEMKARYEALEDAGEGKWEEAKEAFNSASESFKEGFEKLASIFR